MRYLFLLLVVGVIIFFTSCTRPSPLGLELNAASPAKLERGKYLVEGLGACGACHFNSQPKNLSGGQYFADRYGPVVASNLTPSIDGLGKYNLSDFIAVFRELKSKNKAYLSGDFHVGLDQMSNSDLSAIFVYLQALPPVVRNHPKREVTRWDKYTVGLFEDRRRLNRYVFTPSPTQELKYGRYLVDNVASCTTCHQISKDDYLGGGREFKKLTINQDSVSVVSSYLAPALRSELNSNFAKWSTEKIVGYLNSSNKGCPTSFYSQSKSEDLLAIAKYLKSL